jgi:hypothetical protein
MKRFYSYAAGATDSGVAGVENSGGKGISGVG